MGPGHHKLVYYTYHLNEVVNYMKCAYFLFLYHYTNHCSQAIIFINHSIFYENFTFFLIDDAVVFTC